jgi:hypothetical protein
VNMLDGGRMSLVEPGDRWKVPLEWDLMKRWQMYLIQELAAATFAAAKEGCAGRFQAR